jgi:hypothetical protein
MSTPHRGVAVYQPTTHRELKPMRRRLLCTLANFKLISNQRAAHQTIEMRHDQANQQT